MILRFTKTTLQVVFVLFLAASPVRFFYALAEENLAVICQIDAIEKSCQTLDPTNCRKLLEKCEIYYQGESDKIQQDLTKTETQKKTLQSKVSSLSKKISDLSYQISRGNLVIKDLGLQIVDTTSSIEKTSFKIADSQTKLANVLQSIYEEDQKPSLEILVADRNISDFFDNLMALELLNAKSKELLQNIKALKINLEEHKGSLDSEKVDLEQTVKLQTLQKNANNDIKKEQQQYLALTESEYQKQLLQKTETQKKAAAVRARIFELIGVPKAPTFGEAYEIAKYVGNLIGIRPALLLAVLTQESNLGKNVGQCYLKDSSTGAGVRMSNNKAEPKTMNPTRDVPHFLTITQKLGRDPFKTVVSCPMSFGWGGAMGPAQFIPSTWSAYDARVQAITGKAPDPWNINDAFMAAGLYLSDYGAKQKNYDGEWKAAMIYFSGSTNVKYRFYGDSVISTLKQYEEDIAAIENGG